MPHSGGRAAPWVVDPVRYPSDGWLADASKESDRGGEVHERIHPYHQASLWRQEMEGDGTLTQAKIAAREGISRARVTQIMNLLALPEEIQESLLNPPAPLEISDFSERFLRRLASEEGRESQLRQWRERVAERRNLVRK